MYNQYNSNVYSIGEILNKAIILHIVKTIQMHV